MSDSELGLALVALLVTFLFGRWRRARIAKSILTQWKSDESVSFQDMHDLVAELAPTLGEQAMVPTPPVAQDVAPVDRGHIWSTPCGKRVYMN